MSTNRKIYEVISSISNWDQFFAETNTLTKQEKGVLFEKLTELVFKTKPIYRSKYKNVWLLSEGIDVKLKKRINLPRADEGIDLIAETHAGTYCAIQCKFKGANEAPTRKDIATFLDLSRNHCKNISEQILVHTGSNGIKKTSLLPDSFTQVGLDFWSTLTDEDWEAIRNALKNKTVTASIRYPRKHQAEAIDASIKYFVNAGNKRGKLIMPCGTGKSLTAYWIAESLESKSTIVAVPSLALIKQSLEDWAKEMLLTKNSNLPDWICICSDESTGKLTDDFVIDTYSLGIPTTTNPAEIESFLKVKSAVGKIIFTTYQSAEKLAIVSRKINYKFDLAILDEAHKTVGNTEKSFSTLLKDTAIRIDKRLFMTATERIVKGYTENILSMDDTDVYGSVIYKLSFKKAIDQSIITDYRIITVLINDNEINELVNKNKYLSDKKKKIDQTKAQMLTTALALKKAISEYDISHTVSFHKSISAAKEFQSLYQKIDSGRRRSEVYHISSKINAGDRSKILKEFKNTDNAIITNARCLTEGVDVPAIDCVLFADGKKSIIDIVQGSGRALRQFTNKTTGKEKELGYIIIPILLKEGESLDDLTATDRFKTVTRVVASLSTQDETIAEIYRLIESGKKTFGSSKIEILGLQYGSVEVSIKELSKKINTIIWQRIAPVNPRGFTEARRFVQDLKIKSQKEWFNYCLSGSKPYDIPSNGYLVYKNKGWVSWGDWLGSKRIADNLKVYRSFKDARNFAHSLRLKSREEWKKYCTSGKKPVDIPTNALQTYKDKGWVGWGDWLGTARVQDQLKVFRPFKEARAFVHGLRLLKQKDWVSYCMSGNRPSDIPRNPDDLYKEKGWINWNDWLGTGPMGTRLISKNCLPYIEAKKFIHKLKLYNQKDWRMYTKSGKKPNNIPSNPAETYKNRGWSGWRDWLGTDLKPHQSIFLPYKQARKYVVGQKIKSKTEWFAYCKSGLKPSNIPANPAGTYSANGWISWAHWLGK